MMRGFFYKLVGKRSALPNDLLNDYVKVLAWHHPIYVPGQHTALEVCYKGEKHYLSFSPDSLEGLSEQKKLSELREGKKASFLESYEEELLIQGFRNAWPGIKSELTINQSASLKNGSIGKMSEPEILQITNHFSEEKKNELRKKGEPTEVILLRSLDLEKMIEEIKNLKEQLWPLSWASWAGTYFRSENTHNCASVVLHILYKGGMASLLTSTNDLLGVAGLLLGSTYALITQPVWYEAITEIVIATLSARGLGGAYEGYTGIQSFLNLTSSQGKDNYGAVFGLRIIFTLFSTFVGALKPGPSLPALLTVPREVLNLAHQAKAEEESMFLFRREEKERNLESLELKRAF